MRSSGFIRDLGLTMLVLGLLSGCDRTELDPKPVTAASAVTSASQPSTASPSTTSPLPPSTPRRARCVAPWPRYAAPQEPPASICPTPLEGAPPSRVTRVHFEDAPGKPSVRAELALTEAQRARGLMYRTTLAEGESMLFVFDEEAPRTFWMHNTCIPLDMLFIDAEGFVAGILEQVPVLNDLPRAVPCPAKYVLETPAGFCRHHGVAPGQRITIDTPRND